MSDCIILTMSLRRFYPFAIAAASLVYQTTFLYAQSTRQDSLSSITSLTGLNHPRQGSASLGRIDASTNDEVNLGFSGQPGPVNADGNTELLGSGSRGGTLRGAPSSAKFSQRGNLPNLAGSGTYTASSLRTPRSKTTVMQRTWGLQPRKMGLDAVSGEPKSFHDERGYEKASRMKTLTNDSGTTGAVQAAQSPFEGFTDPFQGLLTENFEGFNENHMEQPCGDACSLRSRGGGDESFGYEADHSDEHHYSHKLQAKRGAGSGDLDRIPRTNLTEQFTQSPKPAIRTGSLP
jgi:hypothetical protein